jgi:hypothetical protein
VTWGAFTPVTYRIAELAVPPGSHDFGVRSADWPPRHELGRPGSPRWRLTPDIDPDEGWEFETLPAGYLVPDDVPVPDDFEWAYLRWAEGTRAEEGIQVLAALPPGQYLLVRSSLEPVRTERVLLGHESVPSPANTAVVLDARPHYAMVLGAHSDRPPATDRPLIGFVALDYVAAAHLTGVLFLDGLDRPGVEGASGDLVLVVPVTGELVIDAMANYRADDPASLIAWRDAGAQQLAAALLGVGPSVQYLRP